MRQTACKERTYAALLAFLDKHCEKVLDNVPGSDRVVLHGQGESLSECVRLPGRVNDCCDRLRPHYAHWVGQSVGRISLGVLPHPREGWTGCLAEQAGKQMKARTVRRRRLLTQALQEVGVDGILSRVLVAHKACLGWLSRHPEAVGRRSCQHKRVSS